jgi:hypothetical protein
MISLIALAELATAHPVLGIIFSGGFTAGFQPNPLPRSAFSSLKPMRNSAYKRSTELSMSTERSGGMM